MTTSATSVRNDITAHQLPAANGLAIVRVTIGAMFVSVFFENLGKGLYTRAGYVPKRSETTSRAIKVLAMLSH